MDRRNFIAAAGAVAALGAAGAAQGQGQEQAGNQYFELRKYITLPGEAKKTLENYLRKAAIPAWNRVGIEKVGAFTVQFGLNSPPAIYVLLPHPTLESVISAPAKMLQDEEYMKAAEPFMTAAPDAPAFFRMESSLLRAFDKMPKLETPVGTDKKGRIFELRIYESANPTLAKKKIQMFNEGGEIGIFKKSGMNPVLFGETIVGPLMPNLHYMLCFEDMKQHDTAWDTFRAQPEWKALSGDPQYKDTVSNISDIILKPTGYSQI